MGDYSLMWMAEPRAFVASGARHANVIPPVCEELVSGAGLPNPQQLLLPKDRCQAHYRLGRTDRNGTGSRPGRPRSKVFRGLRWSQNPRTRLQGLHLPPL